MHNKIELIIIALAIFVIGFILGRVYQHAVNPPVVIVKKVRVK